MKNWSSMNNQQLVLSAGSGRCRVATLMCSPGDQRETAPTRGDVPSLSPYCVNGSV